MPRIQIHLTDDELAAIDAAVPEGESRSAYLVRAGLASAGTPTLSAKQRRELERQLAAFVRDELEL